MTTPTLESLKAEVRKAGFQVSAGSWESDSHIYAFSVETCGPATYGHSRFTAHFSKLTGWLTIGDKETKLS